MIHEEIIEQAERKFCHHYSDEYYIRQVETGNVLADAFDAYPCRYTYEETDEPLPEPAEVAE